MIQKTTVARVTILAIAGVLALTIFIANTFFSNSTEGGEIQSVVIEETTFNVILADTNESRVQGLSNHPGLQRDEGMLFIFDEPRVQTFWMKEMLFPLDIIWIDESYTIVGFEENAQPDSFPQTFSSVTEAQYVLEVNAGVVSEKGIKVGSKAHFK